MTEITTKQSFIQYIEELHPISFTSYSTRHMNSWLSEEPPVTINNNTFSTPQKPQRTRSLSFDSGHLNSGVNPFTLPETPVKQPPAPEPLATKPTFHKWANGTVRFIIVYFLFPLVGKASLYCNGSLCGIKIVCAVAIFNSDKERSKKLTKEAFLHGAIAAADLAIGYLSLINLIYGLAYAVTPAIVANVQEKLLNKYETKIPHSGTDAPPPPDLRPIFERCVDVFMSLLTGSSAELRWYQRFWQIITFKPA